MSFSNPRETVIDNKIESLFRDAGLKNAEMDPTSLEALRELLKKKQESPTPPTPTIMTFEESVLQQLDEQSRMLRVIQKRVDAMSLIMNYRNIIAANTANNTHQMYPPYVPAGREAPHAAMRPDAPELRPREAAAARPPPPPPYVPHWMDRVAMIPTILRTYATRFVTILKVFVQAFFLHAAPFDAWRLFVVLAIVLARMDLFAGLMATFAVGFFLLACFLIKFLYIFFVKENYPARIWAGEDVQLAPAVAVPVPMPGVAPRGERRGWRDAFFQGHIPAAPQQQHHQQHNRLVQVLVEIGLAAPDFVPELAPFHGQQGDRAPLHGDHAQIPHVRPPRDPFEVEDVSSDEDEDE
jgi:hypothetical protein